MLTTLDDRHQHEWSNAYNAGKRQVAVSFVCKEEPTCTLDCYVQDNVEERLANAKTFPLAAVAANMKGFQLRYDSKRAAYANDCGMLPILSDRRLASKICVLTTGEPLAGTGALEYVSNMTIDMYLLSASD